MYVHALAFTGNVLLVWGNRKLVAWRLTEKGIAVSASANRRADRSNSIWTVSTSGLMFLVERQTVAIKDDERNIIHAYHTLEPEKYLRPPKYPHTLTPANIPPKRCIVANTTLATAIFSGRVSRPKVNGR